MAAPNALIETVWDGIAGGLLSAVPTHSSDAAAEQALGQQLVSSVLILAYAKERPSTWSLQGSLRSRTVILVGFLLFVTTVLAVRFSLRSEQHPRPGDVVISASSGVPAFHMLRTAEVVTPVNHHPSEPISVAGQMVGRFTLVPLASGSVITSNDVTKQCSRYRLESGRPELVALTLRTTALGAARSGDCVSLIFAPKQASTTGAVASSSRLDRVSILMISANGDTASILIGAALTDTDRRVLAAAASSDLVLVAPAS